jgi:hypothetical protein
MFCNQCGNDIQAGYGVCPKCGQAIAWPVTPVPQTRLQRHLRTLAILWVVVGCLWLVPSLIMMALGSVAHLVIPGTEALARNLGPLVLFIIGGSLLIVGAGGIMVGWGLMRHQSWARMTAIVVGVLALFHPPFGTALGIYTLWVLLPDGGGTEYQQLASVS